MYYCHYKQCLYQMGKQCLRQLIPCKKDCMNSQLIYVNILYLYTQQLAEKFCKIEHSLHLLAFHMIHHLFLSKTIETQ